MGDVLFYHLTISSAEQTLRALLPRALDRGWQVELRGPSQPRMAELDTALWLGADDGFLPHGLAGVQDDDQPVLLSWETGPSTAPRPCLIAVDGAGFSAEEARTADRCCLIFDGHAPDRLAAARDLWRSMTAAGLTAQYWAEEDGRWIKKSTSGT